MADTTFDATLEVQQWQDKFWVETTRGNRFQKFIGSDENNVIQLVLDLQNKPGITVTVELVQRLTGDPIYDDNTLKGNEDALNNYGDSITLRQQRKAVRRGDFAQMKGNIELLSAARMALMRWAKANLRDTIILRFESPNLDGQETYTASSETDKDTWLDANQDRALFGVARGNLDTAGGLSGGADHSDSLATIAAGTDEMSPAGIALCKRLAQDADPHITPITVGDDSEEFYVLFANKWAFRDLRENSVMVQANREAMERGKSNPLFSGGDLMWNNVLIKEVLQMPVITGAGAAGIDVACNFFCGAQALILAYDQTTTAIKDNDDYNNLKGVGVKEVREIKKAMFNTVQNGMVSWYTPAVADA